MNIIQQASAGDRVRDYLGPLPVWPVAFYLLRAGAKREAVDSCEPVQPAVAAL